ncbi:MAG: hypothetical protein IPM86_01620 [Saprospiraceae bacterium]|nr:hypothetical protein [Saprospiraceae bacterium]
MQGQKTKDMSTATCLKGTLDKYVPNPEMPWNERRVRHLLNKLKGGATLAEIQNALKESDPEAYIKNYLPQRFRILCQEKRMHSQIILISGKISNL